MPAELRKAYRVPTTLIFKVFDKYDTVEFCCAMCGQVICEISKAKLVFNRDTERAMIVCSTHGPGGCTAVTKSALPQSAEMTPLVERMIRRNGGGTR